MFIGKFEDIFSYESLIISWLEFRNGKKKKSDVAEFVMNLSKNIFNLNKEIMSGQYKHGGYKNFQIREPKIRDIHKANVRDRVLHHAIYRAIYAYFDNFFIFDSYSCRINKGTHRALDRFKTFVRKEGCNHTKTVWVLKGDIRKCFASIDHEILKNIIGRHVECPKITQVINEVIDSFSSDVVGRGIPLGNLTSQIFVNIYLNEFDQYIKRVLKVEKYIRYADDFVIFSRDKKSLENLILEINKFLITSLKLELHSDKVFIKTVNSGVDFLGWVHFEKYLVLRTKTKRRVYQAMFPDTKIEVICSYLGLLGHGDTYKIQRNVLSLIGDNHKINTLYGRNRTSKNSK